MFRTAMLLSFLLAPIGHAQEKAVAPPTVTWHGQSFFTVKSSRGITVAFDPHLIMAFGRAEGVKADVVTLSHLHNDHTAVFVLENPKQAKVLSGLSGTGMRTKWNAIDETFKDIHITTVPSFHDDREGLVRGKNAIFIVEMDGWRICHLGDLGHKLNDAQVKRIGAIDVLMIPVGGIYTLNGSEARHVVEQLNPKEYIFPMHYGNKIFDEILPIDEFLEDQDRMKIAVSDDNAVTLNKDAQRPRPLIVQLNYWPKKKN